MDKLPNASIFDHSGEMPDPRVEYLIEHKLIDIMTIALCAIIAGADNLTEVEQFGHEKQSWFEEFLELPAGIPTHDRFTLSRHKNLLDGVEKWFYTERVDRPVNWEKGGITPARAGLSQPYSV